MSENKTNPLNTKWCVWYHNPMDKNWSLNSYIKLYEFDSIESFWDLYKNWDDYLPKIYEGMFFIMRKLEDNLIYPLWEDKHNRNGGFWSFKINKEAAKSIWEDLSVFLISESLCVNTKDSMMINGISISPKKSFCIIKIWNNNKLKCDLGILSKFNKTLNYNECMYKCHIDNISNDKIKTNKYKNIQKKNTSVLFKKRKEYSR
jgi:hypothetical protein